MVLLGKNPSISEQTLSLEVDDSDGCVDGGELIGLIAKFGSFATIFKRYAVDLSDISRYMTVRQGREGQSTISPDTRVALRDGETLSVSIDLYKIQADNRNRGDVDGELISLAENADICIIVCYRNRSAFDSKELAKQQALGSIQEALDQSKKLSVLLIDPLFKESHRQQVVDYLQQTGRVKVAVSGKEGDELVQYMLNDTVKVTYVGEFVAEPTQKALKERGLGRWYSS